MQHCVYEQTQDETLAHSRLSIHPRLLLFTAVWFMSYYTDYSPEPVTRTIIAVSCITLVGALPSSACLSSPNPLISQPVGHVSRGTYRPRRSHPTQLPHRTVGCGRMVHP